MKPLIFCTILLLTACADKIVTKPGDTLQLTGESAELPKSPYRIGPGDEVEIKFFFTPELNDKSIVRPDGYISIMFADDVKAAGLTPKQLTKTLKKKLAKHVKQLDLSVAVRSFGSQRVFIGGEVAKPGSVTLTGNQTIMQVLDEAGWSNPQGKIAEVVLIRRNEEGFEEAYPLNLTQVISGEDMPQNVYVKAGDTIYVPPHGAVETGRWMERNVRNVSPLPLGFVINRGVGP